MPGQMLRELYSDGEMSSDEFSRIEETSKLRSQIAHGFAPQSNGVVASDAAAVHPLSEIARRLVSESQTVKHPA